VGFGLTLHNTTETNAIPGFYYRKRQKIEAFLAKVASTSRQGLCDAVFHAIESRLLFSIDSRRKDPALERDLKNLRTFSLIAAGCGGKLLSCVFRAFVYDYRHYSGGLPDLLLVRAVSKKKSDGSPQLVDLSDWVGESLSAEFQQEQEAQWGAQMIADDEFLGCSKVGDSGNTRQSNWGRGSRPAPKVDSFTKPPLSRSDLPPKLELLFNDLPVEPECMMVEVKSSNDRLDARQEDWLNILSRHGNARVCKFEDTRKSSKRKLNEVGKAQSTATS